jgi:RsiW-degrading membrane proteinase PrsW (M82 family)
MNYIEHIYICLAAPLLIAVLCTKGRGRRIVTFIMIGMTTCLLSSYISSFLAASVGAPLDLAAIEISPLVEEVIKILPVLVYLTVFSPEGISECVMMTAIGFATFENVGYLTQKGASDLLYLIIRGFGTGAMHVVCANIVIIGLIRLWKNEWMRIAGTVALLTVAITFHGVYNILAYQTGVAAYIGYSIPLIIAILTFIIHEKTEDYR